MNMETPLNDKEVNVGLSDSNGGLGGWISGMEDTDELEKFESWVRSHFLMHHEWLKPGQGKWRYAKNETLFMLAAWKARGTKPECDWVPDADDCRAFETTCGNAFVLNEGDPRTNGVLFCPYCGGKLKHAKGEK
jgi:hypothetical protein